MESEQQAATSWETIVKSRPKRSFGYRSRCLQCNRQFFHSRGTAVYCSNSCKQAAYRSRMLPNLSKLMRK